MRLRNTATVPVCQRSQTRTLIFSNSNTRHSDSHNLFLHSSWHLHHGTSLAMTLVLDVLMYRWTHCNNFVGVWFDQFVHICAFVSALGHLLKYVSWYLLFVCWGEHPCRKNPLQSFSAHSKGLFVQEVALQKVVCFIPVCPSGPSCMATATNLFINALQSRILARVS